MCGVNYNTAGVDKSVPPPPSGIPRASSCTALCLKNATPDECGCNGDTSGLGIILNSGSTGSNANTNNDSVVENDYVGTIPTQSSQQSVSPSPIPPPVQQISYAEGCKNLKCAIDERCTQDNPGTWSCTKIQLSGTATTNPITHITTIDYGLDEDSRVTRVDNTAQNIVIPPTISKPKYTSKADCEANTNQNSKAYEACGQYASNTENQNIIVQKTKELIDNIKNPDQYAVCNDSDSCNTGMATLDTLIPDSYINYWQGQTANAPTGATNAQIAFSQQAVLDTLDYIALNDQKVTRYVSNYQRINEETYDPNSNGVVNYLNSFNAGIRDKETLASTIDLGVTMTAEAYTLTVAAPLALTSGGVLPGALSLMGQAQVVSTAMQGGNTTTYCILNGLDENCQQQIARTGLSVATIGVSQYANTFGNALGRFSNTVTTAANFGVDSADAVVAFSDPNADALTKAMSLIAVVGDIGGGVMDFNQGQLGFGGADINIIKNDINRLVTTDSPGFQLGQVDNIPKWNTNTAVINEVDLNSNQLAVKSEIPLIEIASAKVEAVAVKPVGIPTAEKIVVSDAPEKISVGEPIAKNVKFDDPLDPNPSATKAVRDYVFNKTDLTSVIKSPDTGEVLDSYEILLAKIKKSMTDENLTPLEAVNKALLDAKPTDDAFDLDELSIAFIGEDSISARVLCNGRIDCLETPILQEALLTDLNTGNNTMIIGLGGTRGNADLPFQHGALITGEEIVGYNLKPRPTSVFQRYADISKWGNFGLSKPVVQIAEKLQPSFVANVQDSIDDLLAKSVVTPIKNLFGGDGTTFGDTALVTVGSGKYKSTISGQKLIINPEKDPALRDFMARATTYLMENRTNSSVPRINYLNDFVHENIRYATGDQYNGPTRLREEIYAPGTAYLGQFTQARAGVCREYAACLHVLLADNGKPSYMVVGEVNSVTGDPSAGDSGKHAWVEYIDTKTNEWMVADPTNGFITTREDAYKNMFAGVSEVERDVFIWPEGTSLIQRLTKKITAN